MGLLKTWTSLHTKLAAETHLTDGEFVQVTENRNNDDDDNNDDNDNSY
jgi:hypothetical protein